MVTNDPIINEIIKLDIDNKFDVCAKTLLLLNLSIVELSDIINILSLAQKDTEMKIFKTIRIRQKQ